MITGSLRTTKGYYYMVLNLKDENGKRKQKVIRTGLPIKGNKTRAENMLLEARMLYESIEVIGHNDLLFTDLMLEWLEVAKRDIQPNTYAGYARNVSKHILTYFISKKIKLVNLSASDIQKFYNHLSNVSKLGNNSIIRIHSSIRSALDYAYRMDYIVTNVADKKVRPKETSASHTFYDAVHIKTLFLLLKDDVIKLPVQIASYYGMRRSEVVGLRWSSVDFERRIIQVNHTVITCKVDGKYSLIKRDITKSKSSLRNLAMNDVTYNILLAAKEKQIYNKALCGSSYNMEHLDYVCVNDIGDLIQPDTITSRFNKIVKANSQSIPHMTFHGLRHAFASLLLQKNEVNIKVIQECLGHSSVNITLNYYGHINTESKVKSAECMQALLS